MPFELWNYYNSEVIIQHINTILASLGSFPIFDIKYSQLLKSLKYTQGQMF